MKQFFIACSILLLILYVKHIEGSCFTQAPMGFTSSQFYATPRNVTIEACDISNENTCCTTELSRTISQYSDSWTAGFLSRFSYTTTTCKGGIQGLSCLLCSADQRGFTTYRGSQLQYLLCASYCEELLNSCQTSKLANMTVVGTAFGNDAASFCYEIFRGIEPLKVSLVLSYSDDYCWSDRPVCTDNSYYYEYTQCIGGTRSKVYQKKPEVTCSGGVPLPPTETGLPCAISCTMGKYASRDGCTNCTTGKYSLGSAVREDSWLSWDSLNIPFQTYCTYLDLYRNEHIVTDVPCGWTLTGGFEINSGHLNSSQSAYLETSVVLIGDGVLAFNYKVDSEPHFDGLTVYVDREVVFPKTSTQLDFTLQTIPITSGYHFIQFVYSKDVSISVGLDQAAINLVQLSPVNYATDECTPCRPGRYQNETGKSFCYDCPANTYSAAGASRCSKCPPNYYSPTGSSSCTPQTPCTIDDIYYLFGDCYLNQDGELVQDQYPLWNTPHICNDYGNPTPNYPNITSPCSPCNPGEYRSGTQCNFCPDGYYSDGIAECQGCEAGSAAVKILHIDHFDSFDEFLTTDCSYFCGSPGWELHNEYIDSGSGHGRYVNSNLRLRTTLLTEGTLTFKFSLFCQSSCSLSFTITNSTGGLYTGGPNSVYQSINQTVTRTLSAGDIDIEWVFTKSDPDNVVGRSDSARIEFIYVTNVEEGGADKCSACAPGYYSAEDHSTVCEKCPPGTYSSSPQSVSCTPCADGYFNSQYGQSKCMYCGEGGSSNSDHTGCLTVCTYLDTSMLDDGDSVNDDENDDDDDFQGVFYDISPMARTDNEMYGPIYDALNQAYFLNLCAKDHSNNTCLNVHGDPIETFACQVTTLDIGMDLGNIFGILPLRPNEKDQSYSREGVTVHLTNGATCLNTTSGQRYPRQTYIDIVCHPLAGVGFPSPLFSNNTVELPSQKCVYNFEWFSLYGCHVCTEDDYAYIVTACDNNQKRFIQYFWIDNPKRCHGGVSLPATQELSCVNSDATYCPPGQYLDLSVSDPVCENADPGFFSIGGGNLFTNWTSLPTGFSSISWTPVDNGAAIRSGFGDSSLFYLRDFVEEGEITFSYKLFGYGNSNGGFTVTLDNQYAVIDSVTSTNGVWTTTTISRIPVGNHFITFEYLGGYVSENKDEDIGVMIADVKILGTSHAAEYQVECDPGYYSTGGASICTPCPANTYSMYSASEICDPCPEYTFSFPGSTRCFGQQACTIDDYQKTYSTCDENHERKVVYVPLAPLTCNPTSFVPPEEDPVPCDYFDCDPGQYRDELTSLCTKCEVGSYWDSSKKTCSQSTPGYAGILVDGFYNHPEADLPDGFETGCSGSHCLSTSNGWRSRSTYLDSGANLNLPVDIYLSVPVNILFDGDITFSYNVDGDQRNGVFFFIDGKQQDLDYHPSSTLRSNSSPSFPLTAGAHSLRWVYHQEDGAIGAAQLSNILITGMGGSTAQTACSPGSYSNSYGSNFCSPCPAGTYSSSAASTSCASCPDRSFASSPASTECQLCGSLTDNTFDHTDCITDCKFKVGESVVDLSPLSDFTNLYDIHSTTSKLWLNVCAKKSSSVFCLDPITSDPISTYSCQVDSLGSGIDSGNLLSVTVLGGDIVMTYSNGQTTDQCPSPITTEIRFVCDPTDDSSSPVLADGSTPCRLKLTWAIAFACPLCTPDDYIQKSTDCIDGQFTTASIRNSSCFGPQVIDTSTSTCTEPIYISIVVVIIIVVIFVVLVIVAIVIIIWNRRLHSQYTALVQKGEGSYEMSEVPNSAQETTTPNDNNNNNPEEESA